MNQRIVFATLAALAVLGGAAAQDDRNSYYWSNGEQVRVDVAPSSVALRFSVDPEAGLIDSIGERYGLRVSPDEIYAPLRGNRTVAYSVVGATQVSNRYLVDLRNRLTQAGEPVTDVGRLVTTAGGTVAAMTQDLLVAFVDGVSGLGDLRGLEVGDSVSVARTLNPRPLIVAYSVNANSELTPLEIANTIYEYMDDSGRRLVRYALPTLRFPAEFRDVPNQPRNPDDDYYPNQWHLSGGPVGNVDAPEAWDYTRGSSDEPTDGSCQVEERIRIAVLDSGVQLTHEDLVDNISQGGDYTTLTPGPDGSPDPLDGNRRHGTFSAGIIAACGDNGKGVSGICPLCEIVPIRIYPENMAETIGALLDAKNVFNADVISNSWGRPYAQEFADTLDIITGANPPGPGIPVFFAVPNKPNQNKCAFNLTGDISATDSVIAVSGSTVTDVAGDIGSFGDCIDMVAPTRADDFGGIPSGMVVTTDLTTFFTYAPETNGAFGTSASAPLAAGIAGLVLSLNPNLTPKDVRDILQHTADKITIVGGPDYDANGFSPMAGYGRVNAHRAVVPVVKITALKMSVAVNEPFAISVSASAPYLLSTIGWTRKRESCPGDHEEWRTAAGKAFHEETWSGLTLTTPGKYVFTPNARDTHFPVVDDYPHEASDASLVLPKVEVTVQGTPPACSTTSVPDPPQRLQAQ